MWLFILVNVNLFHIRSTKVGAPIYIPDLYPLLTFSSHSTSPDWVAKLISNLFPEPSKSPKMDSTKATKATETPSHNTIRTVAKKPRQTRRDNSPPAHLAILTAKVQALPVEIRLMIYKHLLEGEASMVIGHRAHWALIFLQTPTTHFQFYGPHMYCPTYPTLCEDGVVDSSFQTDLLTTFCETHRHWLPFDQLAFLMNVPIFKTDVSLAQSSISALEVPCRLPEMAAQLKDLVQVASQFRVLLRQDHKLMAGFELNIKIVVEILLPERRPVWRRTPPSRAWMVKTCFNDLVAVLKAMGPVIAHDESLGQRRSAKLNIVIWSFGLPNIATEVRGQEMGWTAEDWGDYALKRAADKATWQI